ncbi:RidA family protein [Kineosporia sp. R_H_3]|uniref:RidA family protein n=1 Tax=Kineosporia sp. R_H_3 TaxID=1961848 RepID=UPI000B4B0C76|nr:RidA family protein [Kineosporia sp. R_H_3]
MPPLTPPVTPPVTPRVTLHGAPGLFDGVPYAYSAHRSAPGTLLFTAGACPIDATGTVVAPGDVRGQTEQVLANLVVALEAGGASFADVVRTTVYVATTDRADLLTAWEVFHAFCGGYPAPSTLLGVTVLGWPGQLVEIEAVAVLPDDGATPAAPAD